MRKDSKQIKQGNIASVQGYHQGGHHTEQYAFMGFTGNWYFNSDRKEATKMVDGQLVRVDKYGNVKGPFAGYGLEIETECRGIDNQDILAEVYDKIIFDRFKFGRDMFKMQNDISLGGDCNAEVITQVMTKSRIRNDYASYQLMFDTYFRTFGISADSYHTGCGMHVNVSNALFGDTEEKQIEAIRKLYYIVNKHYDFCTRLFYRNPARTMYCGRMNYSNARTLNLYDQLNDHSRCMNLSHFQTGRIEIRLVGGQKNYYTFRNTMESVFFLVERVRNISWEDCDDIVKIFKGCNQYVMKRLPDCGLTSEQLAAIQANSKVEDLELHN